ncbi:MAG: 50S ribosomal protein L21 [Bacilli bacterium]|jgi:large subunit ribosomal protein L21|nr:50S ribosomal protein L21 [Bacilli bacterium]
MYAIIETGGKQLKVSENDVIFVEKLEVAEGDKITFDKVLLVSDNETIIGNPYLENAKVEGTVEKQGKEKKIIVFKYKPKKSTKKKQGHRQPYTKITINSIVF